MDEVQDLPATPRYVPDYTATPIHIPIPGQVCFWLGESASVRNESTIQLVRIVEIDATKKFADWRHHKIKCIFLNAADGVVANQRATISQYVSETVAHPQFGGDPASFVVAKDQWTVPADHTAVYANLTAALQKLVSVLEQFKPTTLSTPH